MRGKAISYSVVIPTLAARDASRAIASVRAQGRRAHEIILAVPHGEGCEVPVGVRVVEGRRGSSSQRNAGARAASGDIVLFVDDDMELDPGFAEAICEVWERHGLQSLSGVAGCVANAPVVSRAVSAFRGLGQLYHRALFAPGSRIKASGHLAEVLVPRREVQVEFAPGCCVSYRRDLLLVEPFSEEFDGYVLGDDFDLAARMICRAPLIQTPAARAMHRGTTMSEPTIDRAYRAGLQLASFRLRHRRFGALGIVAWHWSNATYLALQLWRAVVRGRWSVLKAYRRGRRQERAARRRAPIGPSSRFR
jgi:glycosyltransferase involved in cell wall biosynthesis